MTNEEAIARIKEHKIIHKMNEPRAIYISEALDMAIKALEQQPCDDCISRKDTLAEFKRVYFDNGTVIRCAESVLRGMPPVTPQQKTGHWNRVTDNAGYWVWECDKCGWQQRFHTNYCPDCGAKMQEEEENDD